MKKLRELTGPDNEMELKKKWLWRYREALFKAESLWRQAEEWQSLIYEPSCKVLDGMPKPPGFSNTADKNILKHLELIEEAAIATNAAKTIRKEITSAIESIEDRLGIQVLTLRYVEGFSWKEIEQKINYSRSQTRRIHNSAINELKTGQNGPEWTLLVQKSTS